MMHQHQHLHHRRGVLDDSAGDMDFVLAVPVLSNNNQRESVDENQADEDVATAIRTIYKTMAPTFSGPIAGYSTLGQNNNLPLNPSPTPTPKLSDPRPTKTADQASSMSRTGLAFDMSRSFSSVLASPAEQTPTSQTSSTGAYLFSTETPSISSTADPSLRINGDGEPASSVKTKVGIACGVPGGVLIVVLLVFYLFNRRRKQAVERQKLDDDREKLHRATEGLATSPNEPTSTRSNLAAPRISLRPVTQFLPNWTGFDKRASKSTATSLAPAATAAMHTPGGNHPWDRPSTSQSANSANPFGYQAERLPSSSFEQKSFNSISSTSISGSSASSAAVNERALAPGRAPARDALAANGPAMVAGAVAGTAAAVVARETAALSRKTSMRKGGPKDVDLTLPRIKIMTPPSPAGTEFSMSSLTPGAAPPSKGAAAIAAAGGPQNTGVHRVQLDFKPTLDDELELKAGDLVRLLHEYDDGWALVIRLDRSHQGVVPRTCLSTRPVKPRLPQGASRPGPPVNPSGHRSGPNHANGQRPITPQGVPPPGGRPGLPESPSRSRMARDPASPAGYSSRTQSPMGRPMSPAGLPGSSGPRLQGPLPARPSSPSGMNRHVSPLGPSPINTAPPLRPGSPFVPPPGPVGRKPVPSQAS